MNGIRCFRCIMLEIDKELEWNQIKHAITNYDGQSYCYDCLKIEMGLGK